jgi:aflatoxin B1 aldehyde reductase
MSMENYEFDFSDQYSKNINISLDDSFELLIQRQKNIDKHGIAFSISACKAATSYYNEIQKHCVKRNQNKKAILDTAYYYGNTTTEEILGKIIPDLYITPKISTKVNPWLNNDFTNGKLGQLSAGPFEKQLKTSLTNLGVESIEYLFLHCPDYETSIEETLETCEKLWRKEKFNKFGMSNFSYEHLLQAINICENRGFNSPDVYQGMYNIVSRKIEEIFPLLNDYYIEFWAYNPLAGGLLTGKYNTQTNMYNKDINSKCENSRFKNNKIYQNIFWKEPILNHLGDFFKEGKTLEKSFHWLQYYSKMRKNDKIIVGASTIEQLETNLKILNIYENYSQEEIEYMKKLYEPISEYSPNYYY